MVQLTESQFQELQAIANMYGDPFNACINAYGGSYHCSHNYHFFLK